MTPSPSSPLPNRRRRCTHLISIWASVGPTDLARLAPDSTCSRSAVAHLLTPLPNPTAAPRSPSPPLCSDVIEWLSLCPSARRCCSPHSQPLPLEACSRSAMMVARSQFRISTARPHSPTTVFRPGLSAPPVLCSGPCLDLFSLDHCPAVARPSVGPAFLARPAPDRSRSTCSRSACCPRSARIHLCTCSRSLFSLDLLPRRSFDFGLPFF